MGEALKVFLEVTHLMPLTNVEITWTLRQKLWIHWLSDSPLQPFWTLSNPPGMPSLSARPRELLLQSEFLIDPFPFPCIPPSCSMIHHGQDWWSTGLWPSYTMLMREIVPQEESPCYLPSFTCFRFNFLFWGTPTHLRRSDRTGMWVSYIPWSILIFSLPLPPPSWCLVRSTGNVSFLNHSRVSYIHHVLCPLPFSVHHLPFAQMHYLSWYNYRV